MHMLMLRVHCCRPINDTVKPIDAEGPYEVLDPETIGECMAALLNTAAAGIHIVSVHHMSQVFFSSVQPSLCHAPINAALCGIVTLHILCNIRAVVREVWPRPSARQWQGQTKWD
jgi:hypothetical protein